MSLIETLLRGRPNGVRARVRALLGRDAPAPDRAPAASGAAASAGPKYEQAEKALGLKKEAPKDQTPPDGYEVVLHKDGLEDGRIIEVIVGGTAIAVAKVGGLHYAIGNECAHAHGPLGEGQLDGTTVTCPYHGWKYDVRDGHCLTVATAKVRSFDVKVVGDAVCVRI